MGRMRIPEPGVVDCLRDPMGVVRTLFERATDTMSVSDLAQSDWGVKEQFEKFLHQEGAIMQVPEINSMPLDAIPSNSLVRFRGMVQDMWDVEMFAGAYKERNTWRTGKYSDAGDVGELGKRVRMADRRSLYCVPVPGENKWVKEAFAYTPWPRHHSGSPEKRTREECNGVDIDMDMEEEEQEQEQEQDNIDSIVITDSSLAKRRKGGHQECESRDESMPPLDLNMPLGRSTFGNVSLRPCIVKIYDGEDQSIKLNDVVEFVGVFTFDPNLSSFEYSVDEADPMEEFINPFVDANSYWRRLPASEVPRLHCITFRKLTPHKMITTLPGVEAKHLELKAASEILEQLRHSVVTYLASVLEGDKLAAEYLLLHLLSQVHARVDTMALGNLPLNIGIGGCPIRQATFPIKVAQAVQSLVPCSHFMPLNSENMNKGLWVPSKDYDVNRLRTGALQLADGTHLTVDETKLTSGTFSETAQRNLQSLKHIMQFQTVEYDYEFYPLEQPTDMPILVISKAKARYLPTDIVVALIPDADTPPSVCNESELERCRVYLSFVRNMENKMEPSTAQALEEELVWSRRYDRSLGPDTFHRWLTLARFVSMSHGEEYLTLERWHEARGLEIQRSERLAAY